LKIWLIGRRTCASVSALSLDAQPAQLDRLVNLIWRPEGGLAGVLIISHLYQKKNLTQGTQRIGTTDFTDLHGF
jgi:hypothetical protein